MIKFKRKTQQNKGIYFNYEWTSLGIFGTCLKYNCCWGKLSFSLTHTKNSNYSFINKIKTSELGLCDVHKFAEIFLNYALQYTSCLRPIKEKKPTITVKIHWSSAQVLLNHRGWRTGGKIKQIYRECCHR